MFTYYQLVKFITIVKHQNITKASKELYISQPSLSTVVKQMEDKLGAKLFYQHNNQMLLTELGQAVYSTAVNIISAYQPLIEIIEDEPNIHSEHEFLFFASPTIHEKLSPLIFSANRFPRQKVYYRIISSLKDLVDNISLTPFSFGLIMTTSETLKNLTLPQNINCNIIVSSLLGINISKKQPLSQVSNPINLSQLSHLIQINYTGIINPLYDTLAYKTGAKYTDYSSSQIIDQALDTNDNLFCFTPFFWKHFLSSKRTIIPFVDAPQVDFVFFYNNEFPHSFYERFQNYVKELINS